MAAKKLIAAILNKAYDDYTQDESCREWCPFKDTCEKPVKDSNGCDAKQFIHSAWCATLCDGLNIDHDKYVKTCIKKRYLSKNTYRYVENEIRLYKQSAKELDKLKRELIDETPIPPEIRGTDPGDPTANKAVKISLNKKIIKIERIINAIEKTHRILSGNKKTVMEEYWRGRYTTPGLAGKIGVDETTVRRWKRDIVYLVAIELKFL